MNKVVDGRQWWFYGMNEVNVVFVWIFFELFYCYNMRYEIFLGTTFLTFFPQAISTLHILSTLVRHTVSLLPAELPPSYFQASHPIHARPAILSRSFLSSHPIHARLALLSRSFLRSSPQAISTLHIPSTLVRHSCLTSHPRSSGTPVSLLPAEPHKLFPRFTCHPRSSGTFVSLLPAELPL